MPAGGWKVRVMAGMEQGDQGWGSRRLAVTHLSLFQKHVGAQERISPASQALPHPSLLSWAHPPQPGLYQAGEAELGYMSEDLCPGVQVQRVSISGHHSLQGGGRSNSHFEGCRGPHRPLELPTPHTRMCTRGWWWIRLWSRGFTRLITSFFRIISMFWPCQGEVSPELR